ncbi:MAG: hypothetical protein EOP88_13140 [Verrucomicrobiaceae bacterium]|nr:MAG: hypothetical protein EOP88_13140 [Verrucomicrobiaceae bacterium]
MKSRPLVLSAAVAGCLVGFLAVGLTGFRYQEAPAVGKEGRENTRAGVATGEPPSSGVGKSRESRVPDKRRTFAAFLKDAPVLFERNKPYKDLERMDAGQLKSVILEALSQNSSTAAMADRQAASGVMSAAARELYEREGEKALEWAAAEVPAEQRSSVLSTLLTSVAKDSPDLMKAWADRYRGEYGDEWATGFIPAAVEGAAARGAGELLRVRELLANGVRAVSLARLDIYPDDFDFHLLITKSRPDFGFQDTVAYWAARDKEAAWNGVREVMTANEGDGATYFGAMFRGVLAMEGDEKAAAWLVGKLGEVPEAGRERALQSLGIYPLGSDAISALVRAFPDTADRVSYASFQLSSFRPGSGVAALRALDSPQLQAEALTAAATRAAAHFRPGPQGEQTRALFNSTMDQLQLDPQAREKVMAVLAGSPRPQE